MIERISRNFRIMAIFSLLDKAHNGNELSAYSLSVNAYQVVVNVRGSNSKIVSFIMDILPDGRWVNAEEYVYEWK